MKTKRELEPKNLATVLEHRTLKNGKIAYLIEFSPGLPYDKRTKGVPHPTAWCVETKWMNRNRTADFGILLVKDGSKGPDFGLIHSFYRDTGGQKSGEEKFAVCVRSFLKALGYKVTDAVVNKHQALVESARSKLTAAERDVLGI